jgi:hypothetical protein
MSCLDLEVLQYWTRALSHFVWRRDSSLEIELPDLRHVRAAETPEG